VAIRSRLARPRRSGRGGSRRCRSSAGEDQWHFDVASQCLCASHLADDLRLLVDDIEPAHMAGSMSPSAWNPRYARVPRTRRSISRPGRQRTTARASGCRLRSLSSVPTDHAAPHDHAARWAPRRLRPSPRAAAPSCHARQPPHALGQLRRRSARERQPQVRRRRLGGKPRTARRDEYAGGRRPCGQRDVVGPVR
jgi:hypothetical protein